MNRTICRFKFQDSIHAKDLEETVCKAALLLERLKGKSTVRMDCRYYFDGPQRIVIIDSETEMGREMALLFIALASIELGETTFKLERMPPKESRSPHESMDREDPTLG